MTYFYPRPPRGGRPVEEWRRKVAKEISIHALREEGDLGFYICSRTFPISIHALREEGDAKQPAAVLCRLLFLSTPSARRATVVQRRIDSSAGDFYPRPPRGGRRRCYLNADRRSYFYPRPPRGGRPICAHQGDLSGLFLSTPSARRATCPSAARRRPATLFLSTPSARRAT